MGKEGQDKGWIYWSIGRVGGYLLIYLGDASRLFIPPLFLSFIYSAITLYILYEERLTFPSLLSHGLFLSFLSYCLFLVVVDRMGGGSQQPSNVYTIPNRMQGES